MFISSPSYSSRTTQLDFRQYQGLIRNPDLEPDSFRHESVSARRVYEYKSYRDGQLFHFNVPLDTTFATWRFRVNYTRGCRPGTVSM